MSAGHLMLDVQGYELTSREREILKHPETGGLILFSRNYQSKKQLCDLVNDIREQKPDILIAVDHEGGRVQRFRDGFIRIPPMGQLGQCYTTDPQRALDWALELGWLMAAELCDLDIDISFAPVLDLDWSKSEIIGDRSFGSSPQQVIELATAFMRGMRQAGMSSTGKHFPGHGWVVADSHKAIPTDERELSEIEAQDLRPFQALIEQGLDAIMPAHIIFQKIAPNTAGFSEFWLKEVLRRQLGFQGVIFSDDLTMEGASIAGGYAQRAAAALSAGCDMVLACNKPEGAETILAYLESAELPETVPVQTMRRKAVEFDSERLEKAVWIAEQLNA